MKVRVTRNFKDLQNNELIRKKGDVFEVGKERGEELIQKKFAEKVVSTRKTAAKKKPAVEPEQGADDGMPVEP